MLTRHGFKNCNKKVWKFNSLGSSTPQQNFKFNNILRFSKRYYKGYELLVWIYYSLWVYSLILLFFLTSSRKLSWTALDLKFYTYLLIFIFVGKTVNIKVMMKTKSLKLQRQENKRQMKILLFAKKVITKKTKKNWAQSEINFVSLRIRKLNCKIKTIPPLKI